MLSALQHIVFCERQCALIHIENVWADNAFTIQGEHMHEKVHEDGNRTESRGDIRIARGLPLRSLKLGLSGIADVVEFHRVGEGGIRIDNVRGLWRPFPVEYKRGRPKRDRCDEVQVCAQAICLEEMLGVVIPEGALFYGATHHRFDVCFDPVLRSETEHAAIRLHELIRGRKTPPAVREPKCDRCSLVEICMPQLASKNRSVRSYLNGAIKEALSDNPQKPGGP
ncbi:MAG: CRISPR-associated protein Cas4 [Acidobacteria bacterium]|nr:CRISPR-associated protein Cas4 [Acidobacteriota bacterium]